MPPEKPVPIADLREARREKLRQEKIAKFGGSRFCRVIRADKYADFKKLPTETLYKYDNQGRRIL